MQKEKMTFYIWKSAKLSEDLALDKVQEANKAAYLFADIAVVFFLFYIFSPPGQSDVVIYIEAILIGVITVVGFLISFQKNGGYRGTHFADYFVCLAFPLFIKVNVIVWLIYAAIYQTTGMFLEEIPDQYRSIIDVVDEMVTSSTIVISAGLFFMLMINHISRIALLKKELKRGNAKS